MRVLWRSVLLAGLAVGALTGCHYASPDPEIVFLTVQPSKGLAGTTFTIEYAVDFGAGSVADLYADVDGDLGTLGDRITIASGLPVDEDPVQIDWDTTGLSAAVYRIFLVLRRDDVDFVFEATNPAIVSTFFFFGFPSTRMTMRGQTIALSYADNCPAGPGTTDLYADQDGNLSSLGDRVLIEAGRVDQDGVVQQALWDTTGVPVGSYFIIAVFSEGPLVLGTIVAPAKVIVNDVEEMLPADGTELLSTAANTRVRFSLPILAATVNALTMPVTIGTLPVAGAYTVENGNRDVVFTPDSCFFPAPASVTFEVWNTILETTLAPAAIRSATFETAASKIYCGTSDGGTLSIVDPIGLIQTSAIPVGARDAVSFATASSRGLVFLGTLATAVDGTVVVFDAALNGVLGRVALTKNVPLNFVSVAGVALSPAETILYAAAYEGVVREDPGAAAFLSIIDVANRVETARLTLSRPGRLRNLVVSPDGSRAFVANFDASAIHVINLLVPAEIDTDGNGANGITPLPTATAFPSGVAFDAAATRLFVTHTNPGADVLGVSVFGATSFGTMGPLVAGGGGGHAAVIRRNLCDGRLYAPRTHVTGIGARPAVSILDADVGELFPRLLVDSQGYYEDVAFVYGTTLAVLADHDAGRAQVFDTEDPAGGATGVITSIANLTTVTTIPPLRP